MEKKSKNIEKEKKNSVVYYQLRTSLSKVNYSFISSQTVDSLADLRDFHLQFSNSPG